MVENHQNSLLGKIAAYTEILAADPYSTIFVSLSETYRKMGMLDEAHSVAIKGLAFLPDYAPGHVVLARIKCQQGDMVASEESFIKALDIDPDSLAALVGLSRLYLLLDNKANARNLLLTARELSPADSVINKLLLGLPAPEIEAETVTSEIEEVASSSDVAPAVALDTQVESLETATLAELYFKQGMAQRSLHIYRNLLTRDPDNLAFRRRIRDIELMSSDTSDSSAAVLENPVEVEARFDSVSRDPACPSAVGMVEENVTPLISPVVKLSVLDELNSLLASIQKRRGDV